MVFSHLIFIYGFLPLLMLLYYAKQEAGWRRGILLVFSLVFYAWGEPLYILLMLGSAFLNHLFGWMVDQRSPEKLRKLGLVIAVIVNLGLLGVFKYTGFFVETINTVAGLSIPVPKIALPLGISFYTFQATCSRRKRTAPSGRGAPIIWAKSETAGKEIIYRQESLIRRCR